MKRNRAGDQSHSLDSAKDCRGEETSTSGDQGRVYRGGRVSQFLGVLTGLLVEREREGQNARLNGVAATYTKDDLLRRLPLSLTDHFTTNELVSMQEENLFLL